MTRRRRYIDVTCPPYLVRSQFIFRICRLSQSTFFNRLNMTMHSNIFISTEGSPKRTENHAFGLELSLVLIGVSRVDSDLLVILLKGGKVLLGWKLDASEVRITPKRYQTQPFRRIANASLPLGPQRTLPPPYPLQHTSGRRLAWSREDRTSGRVEPKQKQWP